MTEARMTCSVLVRIIVVALAASLPQACRRGEGSTTALVAAAVDAAERDARSEALSTRVTGGPLIIDLGKVSQQLPRSDGLGTDTGRRALRRVLKRPFRSHSEAEAVRCGRKGAYHSCWVADSGVFVRLDEAQDYGESVVIFTTSIVTFERAPGYTQVCPRDLRLELERDGRSWRVRDQVVLGRC